MPRVLVAADWFPPAYRAGGPVRSIANTVDLLAATHEVHVVAGAFDLGASTPLPGIVPGRWCTRRTASGTSRVLYLAGRQLRAAGWRRLLDELQPDVLYLNGLFSLPFTLLPLAAARGRTTPRIVLAPRGMLGREALAIKPVRKRAFLEASRRLGWFRHVRWHAATAEEACAIVEHFPGAELRIARDLCAPPPPPGPPRTHEAWQLVALGRVHPMKNLGHALRALAGVSVPRPVVLDVVGPHEDARSVEELRTLAARVPQVELRFAGPLPPESAAGRLAEAHYLVSPTRQESYGHSIVEAWSHGCPVLISDRTPWRGLEALGVGWDWPLEEAAWRQGLQRALQLEAACWQALSDRARRFYATDVHNEEMREATRRVFEA